MSEETTVTETPTAPTPPPEVKVTPAEKEVFFKAFLADEPFKSRVTLFDGKLALVFRTLTLAENEMVFKQIDVDQQKGKAKNDDSYLIQIIKYRLAGCLVSVNEEPFCEEITPESHPYDREQGTYLVARLAIMDKWQTFKLGAITDAFNHFEKKVRQLTTECFNQTF